MDASYQDSVHLAKRFQRRRFFRNQPIRNKNGLWRPCLLTDLDKMTIFIEDLPYMLPTKFQFIWESDFKVLLSESKSGLQSSLNILGTYCSNWKLQLTSKCRKIESFNF
jgi:hypothetical protein